MEEGQKIEIEETPAIELPPPPEAPEVSPEAAPPEAAPAPPPEVLKKSNELILRMGFRSAGEIMEALTNDPDMNFDSDELKALVEVWLPFMPGMPAWVSAAIVTATIFGKKIVKHRVKRRAEKEKEEDKSGKTVSGGSGGLVEAGARSEKAPSQPGEIKPTA